MDNSTSLSLTEYNNFPTVLLLGNGLNQAYNSDSWDEVITRLWSKDAPITAEEAKNAGTPFPLKIILGTNDSVDSAIKNNQRQLCGGLEHGELWTALEKLLQMPFDYILTTNYSYEIESAAHSGKCVDCKKCSIKKLAQHTEVADRVENKYLLHSYNQIDFKGNLRNVWHIHGEIRKPDSVVLGHYFYCKLLYKIQDEVEKRGNAQEKRQSNGLPPILNSWVDAFIMGNVYVLGFGFNLSEIDLWWLLNRKKREKARHGKIIFYEHSGDENRIKHALLKNMNVEVRDMGYKEEPAEFKPFYNKAIDDIVREIILSQTGGNLHDYRSI